MLEISAHLLLLGIVLNGDKNNLHTTEVRPKTRKANAIVSGIADANPATPMVIDTKYQFINSAIKVQGKNGVEVRRKKWIVDTNTDPSLYPFHPRREVRQLFL